MLSSLFERVYLKRLQTIIEERGIIPDHQFGFRGRHSTSEQVHRVVNVIEEALEQRKFCSCVFLDVSQAYDRVFHEGFLFKLYKYLPYNHYLLLKSYLTDRRFGVRVEDARSALKAITAGVPQDGVLAHILYLIFTADIPQLPNTFLGTFAYDMDTIGVGNDLQEANSILQDQLNEIFRWAKGERENSPQ